MCATCCLSKLGISKDTLAVSISLVAGGLVMRHALTVSPGRCNCAVFMAHAFSGADLGGPHQAKPRGLLGKQLRLAYCCQHHPATHASQPCQPACRSPRRSCCSHHSNRAPWLRAMVLGANDGLVSTSALMMGVGGGTSALATMRLAGIAGLVGGALSMAVSSGSGGRVCMSCKCWVTIDSWGTGWRLLLLGLPAGRASAASTIVLPIGLGRPVSLRLHAVRVTCTACTYTFIRHKMAPQLCPCHDCRLGSTSLCPARWVPCGGWMGGGPGLLCACVSGLVCGHQAFSDTHLITHPPTIQPMQRDAERADIEQERLEQLKGPEARVGGFSLVGDFDWHKAKPSLFKSRVDCKLLVCLSAALAEDLACL